MPLQIYLLGTVKESSKGKRLRATGFVSEVLGFEQPVIGRKILVAVKI